jgi:hypothetical protein
MTQPHDPPTVKSIHVEDDPLSLPGGDITHALDAKTIRARRRPIAIAIVWAWELAWGLLVAAPLHAWARRTWGHHPDGDGVLFREGGYELATWFGEGDAALGVVVRTTLVRLAARAIFSQIPLGALVASLATGRGAQHRAPRLVDAFRAGAGAWLPLLGVLVLSVAIQGLILAVGAFAAAGLDRALAASSGDNRALAFALVVFGFFGAIAGLVGVVADFARVHIARDMAITTGTRSGWARLGRGLLASLSTARRSLFRAYGGWLWRAAASVALAYGGWQIGGLVGGKGGSALAGLFVAHQAIIGLRVGLRASWLAHALRFVVARESNDKPEPSIKAPRLTRPTPLESVPPVLSPFVADEPEPLATRDPTAPDPGDRSRAP